MTIEFGPIKYVGKIPPRRDEPIDKHVANFKLSDTCAVCGQFPEDCLGGRPEK